MSSTVLVDKDVNAAAPQQAAPQKVDVKSLEYHRQVLQSKLDEEHAKQQYVSPSDNIMSPCTAKLSAYRSKHVLKAKPKSLFVQSSAKKIGVFGDNSNDMTAEKKVEGEELETELA